LSLINLDDDLMLVLSLSPSNSSINHAIHPNDHATLFLAFSYPTLSSL